MATDNSVSPGSTVVVELSMPEKERCKCACCFPDPSSPWKRRLKRKLGQMEMENDGYLIKPVQTGMPSIDVLARVEVANECSALREALATQLQKIQELYTELEEERSSSYTAVNEAMSMILRLQREKAEIQMEARQFKRFAEEKMAHDQEEILAFEEVFYKRDQMVQALSCEVQAYKNRLMSFGINPDCDPTIDIGTTREMVISEEEEDDGGGGDNTPVCNSLNYDYPPLRCISIPDMDLNDDVEFDKYAPGDTPRTPGKRERLQRIELRINQMERSFSSDHLNAVLDKGMIVGSSPHRFKHSQQFSIDSTCSSLNLNYSGFSGRGQGDFPVSLDQVSDAGRESMSDRVYTIDAVHGAPKAPTVGLSDDYASTPRDSVMMGNIRMEDLDIKKLSLRLQALEADRESLKQTIINMRTDSAQLVLLKEIAQNLSKGVAAQTELVPENRIMKKSSLVVSLSCVSLFKWILSFLSWKKKSSRCKHIFGLTGSNVGLLLALDRSPRAKHWRCLTRRWSCMTSPFRLP